LSFSNATTDLEDALNHDGQLWGCRVKATMLTEVEDSYACRAELTRRVPANHVTVSRAWSPTLPPTVEGKHITEM